MRLNNKEKELIDELYRKVKGKFPDIEFKNLSVSPDDYEHVWINVFAPLDDATEAELRDFSAELEADIHIDFGFRISIMPENPNLLLEQAAY